jgi:hypothetical protein
MWLNQDQMFADEERELHTIDIRAIELLDDLACEISDGEIAVDNIKWNNGSNGFLTVTFQQ